MGRSGCEMGIPKSREVEETLLLLIMAEGLPRPEREWPFMPGRKFRFDFAWPSIRVAVEVQGGTWAGGSHVRGQQYENDCVKLCEAIKHGWRVLWFTTDMVNDGRAIGYLKELLAPDSTSFSPVIEGGTGDLLRRGGGGGYT